jgi:hypothetical protein
MQKTLMDEVPDNLKMQVLADSADSVENTTYYKPLTQEELEVKREQSGYKDKMKPLQTENVVLLQEVKTKQAEITGTLYHLANHDTGFMETYNESAELVSTRRLRPNEKQKNVFQISKSA